MPHYRHFLYACARVAGLDAEGLVESQRPPEPLAGRSRPSKRKG